MQDLTKSIIKPCPLCNSKDVECSKYNPRYYVRCNNQDCQLTARLYETEQDAIEAWNKRPIEDELTKIINISTDWDALAVCLSTITHEFVDVDELSDDLEQAYSNLKNYRDSKDDTVTT